MKTLSTIIAVLFAFGAATAQTGSVQGKVETADRQPAAYVNVSLEGTSKGTSTDIDGHFELHNIPEGPHKLITSYVGLKPKAVEIEVQRGKTTQVPAIILQIGTQELQEIVVQDNKYGPTIPTKSEFVAKLPLENIENPQVYNTIGDALLKEQVVTNFDDALKNAPGVEKLWESTGRGGDGAGYYSMRGFAVQPAITNGLPGLTNGSLDPANIERIEVIKGPSGTLYGGSLISYGGLINVVTKKPYLQGFGGELSYTAGSFGLNRITGDVNLKLNNQFAARLVTAYHYENSFQDAGFRKSFYVAPSLLYQVNDRLSFNINTEFITAEGTNPTMLFLYRSAQIEYEDLDDLNYNPELSLTSNDITIENPRFNLQAQMNYKLSDSWNSQTAITRGSARSDGYYTYLWDTALDDRNFSLYVSDQNSSTVSTDIQQNFIGDFRIAGLRNRMVVGLDYFHRNVIDNSSTYSLLHYVNAQGEATQVDPAEPRYLSRQSIDALLESSKRNNSNIREEIYSAYISDVINFTPRLSVMASLRLDYFDTEGDISSEDDNYGQLAFSPKFGIVYQPIADKMSLFANYMNGFSNVAPITVEGGTQTFEPEHADQVEAGVKINLLSDKVVSSLSYYDIRINNRVFSGTDATTYVQGGEVQSKGFELDINANPLPGLNLIAGYSFNESEVIKGNEVSSFAEQGKRPAEAGPKNLLNGWTTYTFSKGVITGFGVGLGANSSSKRVIMDSQATGTFTLPSYTIYNATIYYNHDAFRVALKVDNLTDKEYYKGWSTINPQKPRSLLFNLTYRF